MVRPSDAWCGFTEKYSGNMQKHVAAFPLFPVNTWTVLAKQQSNAPKTCQTYDAVYDPAEHSTLTAKDPCHQVKLKQTDKAPVDGTND